MAKHIDLTGQRFGRLTVIKEIGKNKYSDYLWECLCDCGNTKIVTTNRLRCGITKSCGCLRKELCVDTHTTHNLSKSRLYKIFWMMKYRCYNHNSSAYKYYGAKGITIYQPWLNDFLNFYNWALANGYQDNLTIERIDVNGNYEPSNCIWITQAEQMKNRTNTHFITYEGVAKDLTEWSKELNIDRETIRKYESLFGEQAISILSKKAIERDKTHHQRISRLTEKEIEKWQTK